MTIFAHPIEEGDLGITKIFPEAILTRKTFIFDNSWGAHVLRFRMGRSHKHITLTDDDNDWEIRIFKLNDKGEIYYPKVTPVGRDKFGWMNTFGVHKILDDLKAAPGPYRPADGNEEWALDAAKRREEYEDTHPHDHQDDVDEREDRMDHFTEQGLATEYHQLTGDNSTVRYD